MKPTHQIRNPDKLLFWQIGQAQSIGEIKAALNHSSDLIERKAQDGEVLFFVALADELEAKNIQ